jgi:hypothetical protein
MHFIAQSELLLNLFCTEVELRALLLSTIAKITYVDARTRNNP